LVSLSGLDGLLIRLDGVLATVDHVTSAPTPAEVR
jgi:hypothetical protein